MLLLLFAVKVVGSGMCVTSTRANMDADRFAVGGRIHRQAALTFATNGTFSHKDQAMGKNIVSAMVPKQPKLSATISELMEVNKYTGWTSLHFEATFGNESSVELILDTLGHEKSSELLMKRDCDGGTALHIAARDGTEGMVKHMLDALGDHSPDVLTMPNRNGHTPIYLAAKYGTEGKVKRMLDAAGYEFTSSEFLMQQLWNVARSPGVRHAIGVAQSDAWSKDVPADMMHQEYD